MQEETAALTQNENDGLLATSAPAAEAQVGEIVGPRPGSRVIPPRTRV